MLKGGCTGSSESTLVKMPHCWKSHVVAQIIVYQLLPCQSCLSIQHYFQSSRFSTETTWPIQLVWILICMGKECYVQMTLKKPFSEPKGQ